MKAGRIRTLRGQIGHVAGEFKRQLIIDDGRPNAGLKILEFHVWSQNAGHQQAYGAFGLSLDITPTSQQTELFDAGDNRQIAWCNTGYADTGTAGPVSLPQFSLVDPDHIVNRDLFFYGLGSHDPVNWNYLVVCQEYELTDDEAIVTIIKEVSQNTTK
jgi:hypothetical protein